MHFLFQLYSMSALGQASLIASIVQLTFHSCILSPGPVARHLPSRFGLSRQFCLLSMDVKCMNKTTSINISLWFKLKKEAKQITQNGEPHGMPTHFKLLNLCSYQQALLPGTNSLSHVFFSFLFPFCQLFIPLFLKMHSNPTRPFYQCLVLAHLRNTMVPFCL